MKRLQKGMLKFINVYNHTLVSWPYTPPTPPSQCWIRLGHILQIPKGCTYNITKGVVG